MVCALALCAWCGWASGFPQSTTPAFTTWSVSLASIVAIDLLLWRGQQNRRLALHLSPADEDWPRPGQSGRGRRLLGISPWLVLGLMALVWELLGIDTGPDEAHLTISALARAFRPLDAVLLLAWMLAGLGYGAARARSPTVRPSTETYRGVSRGGSLSTVAVVVVGHSMPMPALLLPQSQAVGVAFWLIVVVAAALIDLTARRSRGRLADAGELVRLISGPPVARILLVGAWAFSGWHLFAH